MQQKTEILIIGGGVVGLSSAWKLAREGRSVTLMTSTKCGEGATLASLGVLMPYAPWMNSENVQQQLSSLWSYPEFAQELLDETGIDIHYKRLGRIQWLGSEHQARQYKEYLQNPNPNWGPKDIQIPQYHWDTEDTHRRVPELAEAPFGVVHCKATGVVDVTRLTAALRSACLKNGVDLREDCPVTALRYTKDGTVDFAQTAHGKLVADHYVLAAGAWSQKLLPENMQNEQWVKPLKGQAVMLQGEEPLIPHLIRAKGLYILPLEGNRFMVGATKEDVGFDDTITEESEDKILSKAESILPALAEAKIIKRWVGFRPQAGVHGAQINWCPSAKNLLMAFGHGGIGICMTPYISNEVVKKFQ